MKNILMGLLVLSCVWIVGVKAETVSGFEVDVSTYQNEGAYASFDEEVIDDVMNRTVEISSLRSNAYYIYKVKGLDPNKVYVVNCNVKTDRVSGNATVGLYRKTSDFYNYAHAEPSIVTTNWNPRKLVLVPNADGTAELRFGFEYDIGMGKMYFRDVEIKEIDTDEYFITRESTNKKVKIVLWKHDFEEAGINNTVLGKFVDRLEKMYETLAEFVGNSTHGTLYPNNGKQIVYVMTNYIDDYGALAGYPIEMDADEAVEYLRGIENEKYIPWVFLHETAHLFDLTLSNGSYSNTKGRFISNDVEQTASFYPLYVMEKMDLVTNDFLDYKAWIDKYENTYKSTLKNGEWNGDAYNYLLTLVKSGNNIDWNAFKETFKWFNDLSNEEFNKIKDNRTMWFLKKLDDYSDTFVRGIFSDTEFRAILRDSYNPMKSIKLNMEEGITLKDEYQLNPVVEDLNGDVVMYMSGDEDVITVSPEGLVKLRNSSKSEATVTVCSFLDPSIKATYTFKIDTKEGSNQGNEDNKGDDKNNNNNNNSSDNKDGKVENPNTGIVNSFIKIVLISLTCGLGLLILNKKRHFKNL